MKPVLKPVLKPVWNLYGNLYGTCMYCLVLSCLTPDTCLALDFVKRGLLYAQTVLAQILSLHGHHSADSPASRAERYIGVRSGIMAEEDTTPQEGATPVRGSDVTRIYSG